MMYQDFIVWKPEDLHVEWVHGWLQPKPPVTFDHQQILIFLTALMRAFTEHRDLGKVIGGRFQMHLTAVQRGSEPDVIFIAKANIERLQENYLDGPADIAVEIISPGGAIRDRGEKYAEYEASGVREYWIVDPMIRRADFFVLDDEGRYNRAKVDGNGVYRSTVLNGFWIEVNWLWQRPLPPIPPILKLFELI